jgi:membrane protease subunit HflC
LLSFATAFVLVLILLLYLVTYRVRFSDVAVLTTFGKITDVKLEPGNYWKWPWPVQNVRHYDRRVRILQSPRIECQTEDQKTVILGLAVGWKIDDPGLFHRRVKTVESARSLLGTQAASYPHVVGRYTLADLISPDETRLRIRNLEQDMKGLLDKTAATEFGVRIEFARITHLSLPQKATEAVLRRMRQEHEKLAENYRQEGEAQAKKIIEEANKERDRLLAEAQGKAERIKGEGDAEAAEHYRVFAEHPQLAIFLAELKALEEIRKRTTIILDTRTPPYSLLETRPEDLRFELDTPESKPEGK